MELTPTQALNKFENSLCDYIGAGDIFCEYENCNAKQSDNDTENIIFHTEFKGEPALMCKPCAVKANFTKWLRDNDITLKE